MIKFFTRLFMPTITVEAPKSRRGRKMNSGKWPWRQTEVGGSFIIRNRKTVSGGMLTKLANEGIRYSQHRMKSGIKMTRVS